MAHMIDLILGLLLLVSPCRAQSNSSAYPRNVVIVGTGTLPANFPAQNVGILKINALGVTLISTNSVAFTSQPNTFTSSQTIKDGIGGGLLVSGDSVTASAFFGDGSHLSGISASPGGVPGQIQYNSASSFAGVPNSYVTATSTTFNEPVSIDTLTLTLNGGGLITTANANDLTLQQTGDVFGTTGFKLTPTGANFFSKGINLVDFLFTPSTSLQGDLRAEGRPGAQLGASNSGGNFIEWQFVSGNYSLPPIVAGFPTTTFQGNGGNVGIGTFNPAAILDVVGNAQFGSGVNKSTFTTSGALLLASMSTPGLITNNSSGQLISNVPTIGLSLSAGVLSSNAEQTISYQPGLLSAVNATIGVYSKFVKASTVDNLEGSAITFSCVSNPTVTMYECGASASCASPTTIGTVTVTSAGTVVDGTISNAAIGAGHYVGFAITSGTCASIDIAATAQMHSN